MRGPGPTGPGPSGRWSSRYRRRSPSWCSPRCSPGRLTSSALAAAGAATCVVAAAGACADAVAATAATGTAASAPATATRRPIRRAEDSFVDCKVDPFLPEHVPRVRCTDSRKDAVAGTAVGPSWQSAGNRARCRSPNIGPASRLMSCSARLRATVAPVVAQRWANRFSDRIGCRTGEPFRRLYCAATIPRRARSR